MSIFKRGCRRHANASPMAAEPRKLAGVPSGTDVGHCFCPPSSSLSSAPVGHVGAGSASSPAAARKRVLSGCGRTGAKGGPFCHRTGHSYWQTGRWLLSCGVGHVGVGRASARRCRHANGSSVVVEIRELAGVDTSGDVRAASASVQRPGIGWQRYDVHLTANEVAAAAVTHWTWLRVRVRERMSLGRRPFDQLPDEAACTLIT